MAKENFEQKRIAGVWAEVRPLLDDYKPTEPVSIDDLVEAEVRSLGWSEKMALNGNFAAVKTLSEQIVASVGRTVRKGQADGQSVTGIESFTNGDLTAFVANRIKGIIDGYEFDKKKEVPEGCVWATVTKTFNGMFLATPNGRGKALIVRFDPSGSFHAMKGDRFVLRPTGEIDRSSSGGAANPVAVIVEDEEDDEEAEKK